KFARLLSPYRWKLAPGTRDHPAQIWQVDYVGLLPRDQFVLLHPTVRLLTRGTPESAEVDLYAVAPDTIDPGTQKLIPIEIWVQLPRWCYGRVAPHSGLALCAGVHVQAGAVDHDYRGEEGVLWRQC
uniref:dUTP diphosphatase n=1 Tax=Gopherus evgoodei TaxID=1825980 RepID=A0A8C4WSG3_9SAUR